MLIRLIFAAPLIVHGLAHIGGFLASWTSTPAGYSDQPWIFSPTVTLRSPVGRIFGLLWLLAAVAFVAAGVGLLLGQSWWPPVAVGAAVASLAAIVPWWRTVPPGAKVGAAFDLLVLALLLSPLKGWVLGPVALGGQREAPRETGQHAYTYRGRGSKTNHLLFLPRDYDREAGEPWPLLLFLHGIAKRGDSLEDLDLLLTDGPPLVVEQQPDFPFVVLSPQCPSDAFWEDQSDELDALLDEILRTEAVDPRRIYLTGLSMGGFGTWHYALRHPDRFAAIVPICGGHVFGSDETPEDLCDLAGVPTWIYHGAEDEAVSPRQSEVMFDALRACGGDVRFTLYPGADHATAWHRAYADPVLYDWLLAHELE